MKKQGKKTPPKEHNTLATHSNKKEKFMKFQIINLNKDTKEAQLKYKKKQKSNTNKSKKQFRI